jgi:DNA polymerase III delta subunit
MVVRAYRQLVLAKDMSERMASRDAVAKATGPPNWKTEDLIKLARRWSWPSLRRAYALMLEADLNVKRGVQDDASALQLLVHELARLAPAPAYARR